MPPALRLSRQNGEHCGRPDFGVRFHPDRAGRYPPANLPSNGDAKDIRGAFAAAKRSTSM